MSNPRDDRRVVFVAGLHRSGTSLLTRCLGTHPDVSVFRNTGVREDEGQHLQDVIPPAQVYGGPGRFALDPAAHLTETSPDANPETAARLFAQWAPYWDLAQPLLVEKSPPNLVRTRFLQALFPSAHFVVVTRHPVVAALATQKFAPDVRLPLLLRHWFHAHQLFVADRPHLRAVQVVRYEDLVASPDVVLGQLAAFLGVPPAFDPPPINESASERYAERWRRLRSAPRTGLPARALQAWYERRARSFGYTMYRLPS